MLYKLLFVDDEEIIRKGITNFVDWEKLGFSLVACLKDGSEAIKYVQNNDVDVILTDIKMTFVSGLELAEYVCNNNPHIKVAILSGYKDFEYAKQAINFNVVHFILKPTEMAEVIEVFKNIKSQLDHDRQEKKHLSQEHNHYHTIMPILKEQFFDGIIGGNYSDEKEIKDKIKLLNFKEDFDTKKCFAINTRVFDSERYIEIKKLYEGNGFLESIKKLFEEDRKKIYYYFYDCNNGTIIFLAIPLIELDDCSVRYMINERINTVNSGLANIFGSKMDIIYIKEIENVYSLAKEGISDIIKYNASEGKDVLANYLSLKKMTEYQKRLVYFLMEGSRTESINLIKSMFSELEKIDIKKTKNFLIETLSLVSSNIKNENSEFYGLVNEKIDYSNILKLNGISDLREWTIDIAKTITSHFGSDPVCGNRIIEKAQKYILDNFDKEISLEEAARHVYLSPVYFSGYFKKNTGKNFIDYLVDIRMDKASEYLLDPEIKVYQVAQLVGYKSIKYFSSTFKKHTGVNPSAYRAKMNRGSEPIEK